MWKLILATNFPELNGDKIRYNLSRWHRVVRKRVLKALLWEMITNRKNKLVLDIGCSLGGYSRMLVELSFHVIGTDISSCDIAQAKRSLRTAEFLLADANHLPLRSGAFDLVVAAQFLEHMEQPISTIKILSEFIKHGGILVVETPCNTNIMDHLMSELIGKKAD